VVTVPEHLELHASRDEVRVGTLEALESAEQGRETVLTEEGKPVAVIVPWSLYENYLKLAEALE
jgi:antitoxin (DNA-binding transcriptional repressor) of toxin-antitoxin stability system